MDTAEPIHVAALGKMGNVGGEKFHCWCLSSIYRVGRHRRSGMDCSNLTRLMTQTQDISDIRVIYGNT